MTITAHDIIRSALLQIGVAAPGETVQIEDAQDALAALNRMLDAWNTDRLMIYTIQPETFSFTASQGSYQIGTGGADFPDSDNPVRIHRANVILNDLAIPLRIPLALLTVDQWANVRLQAVTSTWPTRLYCDYNHPYSTLYFWPVPTSTYQFELFTWKLLTQVEALTTEVTFPAGYLEAIVYNLALRCALEHGRVVQPDLQEAARAALMRIQLLNSPTPIMTCERLGGSGSDFNYLTGE